MIYFLRDNDQNEINWPIRANIKDDTSQMIVAKIFF